MSEKILITLGCAPGDITCLTALPRDIHLAYPGKYEIFVATHCMALWDGNPHVTKVKRSFQGARQVHMAHQKYIGQANSKKLHFLTAFHRRFEAVTRDAVPVLQPKGDLYIPEAQLQERPYPFRYWVILAGGKTDFTTKIWSARRWQQVVDQLGMRGIKVVQCGKTTKGHIHTHLSGTVDLLDKTNLRDMLWLIQHADGVICPITFAMHAAGALDKPCVVVAGGREHWWWEAYVNIRGVKTFGDYSQSVKVPHRFLHTQGLLDCCKTRGCWKNKIERSIPDKRKSYCKKPATDGHGQQLPTCLQMITAEHVVEAVMTYYEDGTLPPIGDPGKIELPSGPPVPPPAPAAPTQSAGPIDLFAPIDQLMQQVQSNPTPPVPNMVNKFAGDRNKPAEDPFASDIIGGRTTICVCMYGDYPDMHKACIGSIIRTTRPEQRQIRVVTNTLGWESRVFLDNLHANGDIHRLIHNDENLKKYPAMRQLFYDQEDPITDKWIIWFDDDTVCDRDQLWHSKMAAKINDVFRNGARMIGDLRFWTLNPTQAAWIRSRPWYTGRHFQLKNQKSAPNGNKVFFPSGAFWAAHMDTLRAAGVPDEEIGHNGGDYMIAAQVWQQGWHTAMWNRNKRFVHSSCVERRGLNEIHTGMPGWKIGGCPKRGQY